MWPFTKTKRIDTFWYKYQRYPFDDPQYFSVQAASREAANPLAIKHFEGLVEAQQTVMCVFYPTATVPINHD